MKIRIHKKLNEELLNNVFTVIVPLKIKAIVNSDESKELFIKLREQISTKMINTVYEFLNESLYSYLNDNKQNLEKQLNIEYINFSEIDVNADEFYDVPIISGIAYFDVEIDKPVDKGRTKQLFNTLINDNVLYKEFTLTIEDESSIFNVNIILEKEHTVELGSYI